MSLPASIPKALYQANIDLALRIAALLQENGKQWFDLFAEEASTRLEEGLSQAGSFGHGLTMDKLSALPADAVMQMLQVDMGRWQVLLSRAVQNQTHFADGVQAALGHWQDACTGAFDAVSGGQSADFPTGFSVLPGLSDMAASIRHFMAQAVPAMDTRVTPPEPAPAPKAASTPAARKSSASKRAKTSDARKSAVKKAVAKKAKAPAKATARTSESTSPHPLVPALAPKPLPAVVTASRRSKKPAQ